MPETFAGNIRFMDSLINELDRRYHALQDEHVQRGHVAHRNDVDRRPSGVHERLSDVDGLPNVPNEHHEHVVHGDRSDDGVDIREFHN